MERFGLIQRRLRVSQERFGLIQRRLRVSQGGKKLGEESGSASVEFSILAIPLFIPIFIFITQFATLSSNETIARVLARESVRAYLLSSDSSMGLIVSRSVALILGAKLGLSQAQLSQLTLHFDCSADPCLSPQGRIRATVTILDKESGRRAIASAQEFVSPWS